MDADDITRDILIGQSICTIYMLFLSIAIGNHYQAFAPMGTSIILSDDEKS